MTAERAWWRHATLLLRLDLRMIRNTFRMNPSLALMAVIALFLFPLALVGGGPGQRFRGRDLEPLAVLSLVFAMAAGFGPTVTPSGAGGSLALPIGPRAVYAHFVLRTLSTSLVAYWIIVLPAALIIARLMRRGDPTAVLWLYPLVASSAIASLASRALWTLALRASARQRLALRAALLAWLSAPGVVIAAGGTGDQAIFSLGPIGWLGQAAAAAMTGPRWMQAGFALPLLAAGALALLLPVSSYVTKQGPSRQFAHVARTLQAGERAPMPQTAAAFRREYEPLVIPRGPRAATRMFFKLWLRSVLFMILLVVGFIVGSFVLVLLLRDAPRVDMPDISPAAFIGSIYVAFVWFTGWANAPELQTRFQALRAVRRSSRKRTGKEWMRTGPPPIFVKRWPMLQTLPLDVPTMERAFLVPYLGLLALAAATIASVFLWVSRFAPGGQLIALIAFATAFLLVGAAFVGTRSAKRFARQPNGLLETAHTLGAVLWTGGSMPLTFAGLLAIVTMTNGRRTTPADILMVGAWAAATVVMPAYAYFTARERLVTSKREFEGESRVAFLALGSVVFAAMPVAYLIGQIMA